MLKATIVDIPVAGQARMLAELRRACYGYLLALHLLLLCAAGRTPSEIAAVLFCARSSVYRVVKTYQAGTLSFGDLAAEDASRARLRILIPTQMQGWYLDSTPLGRTNDLPFSTQDRGLLGHRLCRG